MRISDWSSDVCSSDLLVELGDDLAHGLGRAGGRGNDVLEDAAAAAPVLVGRAVDDLLARGGSVHGGHQAALDAPLVVEHRSEEHTSELQSLMRISYAVFCLKTKRTTTQQTLVI